MAARASSKVEVKETHLPAHRTLTDAQLMAPPEHGPLSPLTLFVYTFIASLDNLHMPFITFGEILGRNPRGIVLAVNSNFNHSCQPGYEHLIKRPKERVVATGPQKSKTRTLQGDGTCFNSAVEPVIQIKHPGLRAGKRYNVKCFPTTGETQIPGGIMPDFSDANAVLDALVAYINELRLGDLVTPPAPAPVPRGAPPATGGAGRPLAAIEAAARAAAREVELKDAPRKLVTVAKRESSMINYKFRLNRNSPRILLNLHRLARYMGILERTKLVRGKVPTTAQLQLFSDWDVIVLPPYLVRETKPPVEDGKASFRFVVGTRMPRVNAFLMGKINILGANSPECGDAIYAFLQELLRANWTMFVGLEPRRDFDSKAAAVRASAPATPPPAEPPLRALSDAEVDDCVDEAIAELEREPQELRPAEIGSGCRSNCAGECKGDCVANLAGADADRFIMDMYGDYAFVSSASTDVSMGQPDAPASAAAAAAAGAAAAAAAAGSGTLRLQSAK
jgi:hypothetical protein